MNESNNYDSWNFRNKWKNKHKLTLLNFQTNNISPGIKTIKKLYSNCSDCGIHLLRIDSKIYGICPMCDMK